MEEYKKTENSNINRYTINNYMHGYCSDLANSISIKTDLPIYGIIKKIANDHDHYDHYFIRIDDEYFLDITGKRSTDDIRRTWTELFKDEVEIERVYIRESIGEYHDTDKIADYLINKYGLIRTEKYEKIKDIVNNSSKMAMLSLNIIGSDLFRLIDQYNGYPEDYKDINDLKDIIINKINVSNHYMPGYYTITVYIEQKEFNKYRMCNESIEVFFYELLK